MKKELQDKLYEKYPEIFEEKNWDMSRTCMCWGVAMGDGWYDIMDRLCRRIMMYCNEYAKPIPRFTQVKQKFGRFVVYTHGSDKENYIDHNIVGFIEDAEKDASETCETCGSKEDVTTTNEYWIEKICKKCIEKNEQEAKKTRRMD